MTLSRCDRILPALLAMLVVTPFLHASGLALPGGKALRDRETFAAIDINGDGRVSKAEFVQFELRRRFEAADINRDGRLSREEYLAALDKGRRARAGNDADALFAGGREFITVDDFLNHDGATKEITSEFTQLDSKGRGFVTVDQWTKRKTRPKKAPPAK